MDYKTEYNILKGLEDIVSTQQKHHAEEIQLLNNQHKDVIQELLKQSQSAQKNHSETIKEAQQQIKYARRTFLIAIIALVVSIFIGLLQCDTLHF